MKRTRPRGPKPCRLRQRRPLLRRRRKDRNTPQLLSASDRHTPVRTDARGHDNPIPLISGPTIEGPDHFPLASPASGPRMEHRRVAKHGAELHYRLANGDRSAAKTLPWLSWSIPPCRLIRPSSHIFADFWRRAATHQTPSRYPAVMQISADNSCRDYRWLA